MAAKLCTVIHESSVLDQGVGLRENQFHVHSYRTTLLTEDLLVSGFLGNRPVFLYKKFPE